MKMTTLDFWRSIIVILFFAGIIQLMSGCIAAELGALEAEGAIGFAEASEVASIEGALDAESAASARNSVTVAASGEVSVVNPEVFNSVLEKVRLMRIPGELPKLYVEGYPEPIAEVHAEDGFIKVLKNGKEISIPNTFFSVEGDVVNIRYDATKSSRIMTTIRHGDLILKLGEKDGWYNVRVVQKSTVYNGWIKGIYASPLIISSKKDKHKKTPINSDFRYPDKIQIERNLIGHKMIDWSFDDLTEFQDFVITKEKLSNGLLIQTIYLKLKKRNTEKQFNSEISISYRKGQYEPWVTSDVTQISFSAIPANYPVPYPTTQSQYRRSSTESNNGFTKVVPLVNENIISQEARSRYNNMPIRFDKYVTPFIGNFVYKENTMISTTVSGLCTVNSNVSFVIGQNGSVTGDIILHKNSTLTIYGLLNGNIYNYGGKIIFNHKINGTVTNYN